LSRIRGSLRAGEFYGHIPRGARIEGLRLSEVRHTSGRALPAHDHELTYLSLLLEGGYSETLGGRTFHYPASGAGFHPSGTSHCDEIDPGGARFFCVEMEERWLAKFGQSERLGRLAPGVHEGEVVFFALRLHRELRVPDAVTSLAADGLALEMLAALARENERLDRRPPSWMGRVKERLRSEVRPRPGLGDLARDAGIHPMYLARAFRRFERCSVGEYARRHRVRRACLDLIADEKSLAEIALDFGFSDQAHFTRVFKKLTGLPPGAFRREFSR
jgi:AraC family transcriptional regulator